MAGNRRGFCRSLLLGVNGGSFGRRRCSFCWLHRGENASRATLDGGDPPRTRRDRDPAPSLRRGGLAVFVFTPAKAAGPPALTRPLSPARWTDATSSRCAHRRTTARAADGHGRRGVLSHVLLEAPLPSRFFSPLSSSLGGVSSPASSLLLLLRGGTVVRVFQDVKRSCATMELCRPPVRASRGQGEPHDASRE